MTATSFAELYHHAEQHDDYWIAGTALEFIEEVSRLMGEQQVNRSELARRLGTSPAYVTKLLRGNANLTLATMMRVARALHCEVHVRLTPTPSSAQESWKHAQRVAEVTDP